MNTPLATEPSLAVASPSPGVPPLPLLDRAAEQASAMALRSADAVRDASQQVRDAAWRASDQTARLVRNEPLKSMLLAVATGAALTVLLGLMMRSRA